jgi:uncharacterized OB-fold protein
MAEGMPTPDFTFPLVPIPDERSQPFFDGAADGSYMLLFCESCGSWMNSHNDVAHAPVRRCCFRCFSSQISWRPSAGLGELYAFTTMHQVYDAALKPLIPYNISRVELGEGPRVITHVAERRGQPLRVGMPLRASFLRVSSAVVIPYFVPA